GASGVIRNAPGASFNVTAANPTISFNQGVPAPLFDNLGTVTRSVGAAGFVINAPISGTGAWNVQSGSLDLQGGGTLAGGTTTVSFANTANNFFRRLLVASNAGTARTMTSDVHTTFFSLGGGTYSFKGSAGPPMTQLFADTVAGASSGSVSLTSPMVLV